MFIMIDSWMKIGEALPQTEALVYHHTCTPSPNLLPPLPSYLVQMMDFLPFVQAKPLEVILESAFPPSVSPHSVSASRRHAVSVSSWV